MKTVLLNTLCPSFALGIAGVIGCWAVAAQNLPYDSGSTGADGALRFRQIPVGGRVVAGGAFDPIRGVFIIYGGQNRDTGAITADTWSWDGVNWTLLNPPNSPGPRRNHRMVWDAARGQIVFFGGYRDGLGSLNDTWVWDGATWTQKSPATVPPARYDHNMAYDAARERVVLFGGAGGNEDTYTWDGANWTLAASATRPANYANAAIAYHAGSQRVVMFNYLGQTYLWDGANWTLAQPQVSPGGRANARMAPDATGVLIMFGGDNQNETWAWNGSSWLQRSPATVPPRRAAFVMDFDSKHGNKTVVFGGSTDLRADNLDAGGADTYLWSGTDWEHSSGKIQTADMSPKANGVWNFTTIDVPPGVTVIFKKNSANTPVRWLATDFVNILGTLDLNGQPGLNALPINVGAVGGPGGFGGGRGALRKAQSGSTVGAPGEGPGGGNPGTAPSGDQKIRDGANGAYAGAYGNVYLQPLIGGSGGGGGSSDDNNNGGNGGAGGGAILIASSRDIVVDGLIRANGGDVEWGGSSFGGRGSGGAILLRADRISGGGALQAFGGSTSFPNGRIRLEAYFRSIPASQTIPVSVNSVPSASQDLNTVGALAITKVAGANVAPTPTGNQLTPDVVFTAAGPITVEVSATGVPDGTPVRFRIATSTSVITPTPVNLAAGKASFSNVTVPAGVGTIQAFADFTTN